VGYSGPATPSAAGWLSVRSPLSLVFLRWVLVLAVLWPVYGRQVRQCRLIKPKLTSVILMGR
jgi:hypothetical protein